MTYTIAEIAQALGAEAAGDLALKVTHAAEPADAAEDAIALALDPKFAKGLTQGHARAALVWPGADWQAMGLKAAVFVGRPRFAIADLTGLMDPGPDIPPGIHPTALIDPTADIGEHAAIGPLAVIGAGVRLGSRARIGAHVVIGRGAQIGADALIHAGVRIGHDVRIGDGFIAQPGAIIGSDGFSFVPPDGMDIEATRRSLGAEHEVAAPGGPTEWRRVHSLGSVEIGDDVEVGANTAIDRGTIRATRIGRGTKLDNLVHIAHNVVIGENTLICASVSIAGSTVIGNRCVLGGQVGVNDNIIVGDDVIAAGASKIYTNAPSGRVLMGSPATKMETNIENYKALRRLPRLMKQVAALQKAVSKLTERD